MTAAPLTAIEPAAPAKLDYRQGVIARFYEGVLWRRRNATERTFVRRTCRDAEALLQAYDHQQPVTKAVLHDGRVLVHPEREGLVATLIELWHHRGYTQGLYQPRSGDVVIDAGANVGLFSAYLLRACPGLRVLPIEPAEENLGFLRQNLAAFDGDTDDITEAALGLEPGEAEFMIAHRSLDHRVVQPDKQIPLQKGSRVIKVPVVCLEQVMDNAGVKHVDLLKLDIESAEYALLDGISDDLLKRFDRIAIEPHPAVVNRPAEDLIHRLGSLFEVRWYGPLIQARRR